MRLIDADALITEIKRRRKAAKTTTGLDMVMLVGDMPTVETRKHAVESVPLELLCQWLAGYGSPPIYAIKQAYDPDKSNEQNLFEAWKYHFRELLKSGLMDTEGMKDG